MSDRSVSTMLRILCVLTELMVDRAACVRPFSSKKGAAGSGTLTSSGISGIDIDLLFLVSSPDLGLKKAIFSSTVILLVSPAEPWMTGLRSTGTGGSGGRALGLPSASLCTMDFFLVIDPHEADRLCTLGRWVYEVRKRAVSGVRVMGRGRLRTDSRTRAGIDGEAGSGLSRGVIIVVVRMGDCDWGTSLAETLPVVCERFLGRGGGAWSGNSATTGNAGGTAVGFTARAALTAASAFCFGESMPLLE